MSIIVTQEQLEEIDRQARAYGFEIGRGKTLEKKIDLSEDNPFLDENWRAKVKKVDPNNG